MLREERPFESLSMRMTRDSWVIIFADLMALLLTFFVLVYSMNAVNQDRWAAITVSFADQLNPSRPQIELRPAPESKSIQRYEPQAIGLDYLRTVLEQGLRGKGLGSAVTVNRLDDSLVLSFFADKFFLADGDEFNPRGRQVVFEVASLLAQLDNNIVVTGHVNPAYSEQVSGLGHIAFSLSRASAVGDALVKAGFNRPFQILGYGYSRFPDIDQSISLSRRYQLANRVDVVVMEKGRDE